MSAVVDQRWIDENLIVDKNVQTWCIDAIVVARLKTLFPDPARLTHAHFDTNVSVS